MILIEMLPNLYIGDLESIKYKDQIDARHTINCVKDLKSLGNHSEYVFNIKKNIEQYEIVKMYRYASSLKLRCAGQWRRTWGVCVAY